MNIQTERLENHTARFTVEVEPERLETAKQAAVRKLSKQVNIPGFRKGKAPYNMIIRYIGEAPILEEAIENLGQEVYRATLEESQVEPYGPGQLEDVKYEPTLTFVYTVPLQPTVELGGYRDVRVEFNEEQVTEDDLNRAIKSLQEQQGVTEESQIPAVLGDRVTIDVHSAFVDHSEEAAAETESEAEGEEHDHDEASEAEHDHDHTEGYIHEHDLPIILSDDKDQPVGPGFSSALIGVTPGETREFEITYPDDDKEYGEAAGRKVKFSITVNKVEKITLPEIDDEFAARFTGQFKPAKGEEVQETEEGEEQPLTLEQLRGRVRESLEEEARTRTRDKYVDDVMNEMVKVASISYPEAMIEDQVDQLIESLDQRLRQQGMNLDMYFRITQRTQDDLREEYRPHALDMIKRSLVLSEIARAEKIRVGEEEFNAYLDDFSAQFGPQANEIRKTFNNPTFRNNVISRMLQDKAFDRIAAIGKGEAPSLDEINDQPEVTEGSTETAEQETSEQSE